MVRNGRHELAYMGFMHDDKQREHRQCSERQSLQIPMADHNAPNHDHRGHDIFCEAKRFRAKTHRKKIPHELRNHKRQYEKREARGMPGPEGFYSVTEKTNGRYAGDEKGDQHRQPHGPIKDIETHIERIKNNAHETGLGKIPYFHNLQNQ